MNVSLVGVQGCLNQTLDILKSKFSPDSYRVERQAEILTSPANLNSENAEKQRKLQADLVILQALHNQANLKVQHEQSESLAEINLVCQASESRLTRELQDHLAQLNREFQEKEGELNRERAAKLEEFWADLQQWCLLEQRKIQLELKQLNALLAQEIALRNREAALAAIVKQKALENSPILVTAENIIAHLNPEETPILRIFLSPPVLTQDGTHTHQNFPVSGEFLSNYLRDFLDQYIRRDRPVQFMGGFWRNHLFREEAAAENLFAGLRVIPTLILDSSVTPEDFYLRFGFWHTHFKKYRYKTAINQFPWVETLYSFAKQRTLNWQAKRQAYLAAGKAVTNFERRYGEETVKGYQQNLRILETERLALEEGEDLSELDRPYHLHKNDHKGLAELIGICHALIVGLIADEYCLMFLPPAQRKPPLLPQLLPDLLAKWPGEEQQKITDIVVGYCQTLYHRLAEEQSALRPELRLELAECLLPLPNKKWATKQVYLSVQDWLSLRGLPVPEKSQLLKALSEALTLDDLPYITQLNQCLKRLGANRSLNVIESCWQRGLYRVQKGEYFSAIRDFNQVLQFNPSDIDAYTQRGLAYLQIAGYREAIADFDQVLQLNPDYAEVYQYRGLAYQKLDQLERAIEDFNNALQLNPNLPDALQLREVTQRILEQKREEAIAEERQRREEESSRGTVFHFEMIIVDAKGEPIRTQPGQSYQKDEDLGNGVKLEMVYIPAGSFMMGSSLEEGYNNERPQHQVTLNQPFYLGKYPITQEQWEIVMGNNPSNFPEARRPVEKVSWDDAVSFCQKLSEKTGKNYRLPSEAEWEYACRGGSLTPFYFGETTTPNLVNYNGQNPYGSAPQGLDRQETTVVGSFPPNAFGLYDMHGNVWEWCSDRWHDNYDDAPSEGCSWETGEGNSRVRRGGSWFNSAISCRVTSRRKGSVNSCNSDIGFRVALVLSFSESLSFY